MALVSPVSDDLKGKVGVHQTSLLMPSPRSPSVCTAEGNSKALPTVTIFGLKPCCRHWAMKVFRSCGRVMPAMMSTPAFLNSAICAEKSAVSGWKNGGVTKL
ncbi:hypothetical protein D9M68_860490 [compost metagenome]